MKRAVSLFTVALLAISMFAGCGSTKTAKNGDETELTIFMHFFDYCVYNDEWPIFKEAEEETGIKLKGTAVETVSESAQAFNTMLAGSKLPDIIHGENSKLEKIGKEGALIPLEDLIANKAPNIKKMFDKYPKLRKAATATDGHIYFIPGSLSGLDIEALPSRGWFLREDWLKKLGLSEPKTLDEFHNVLKAFKTKDPNGNGKEDEIPFFVRQEGVSHLYQLFGAKKGWTIKNGEMLYGPATEEYKNAVQQIASWYAEGLIDREIFTRGQQARDQLLSNNTGGCTHDWFSSTASYNDKYAKSIEGFSFKAVAPPADIYGKIKEADSRQAIHSLGWGISRDNKKIDETIKYFDFWMSTEGQKLNAYGVKGLHYTEQNGKITFTDAVLNAEKGVPTYMRNQGQVEIGTIGSVYAEVISMNDIGREGYNLYSDNQYCSIPVYTDSFSDEEQAVFDSYYNTIKTYVDEQEQKWVTGAEILDDAAWQKYTDSLDKMNLGKLVKIENDALKREQNK